MSNDPHTIGVDQLLELVRGLGIEVDRRTLKAIHIEGGKVEVVRYRLNDNGKKYQVAPLEVATSTVTIRVEAKS